ncbi:hypothetical protein SETIT_1G153400v2 [Setaria italica]|uniref:Uncharacterized protein n=1 Tax=Setaria italica TaxID=4555 RepID=A0A368PKL6_SETIT|nr:hypothetical protein SETIT_1G153400v2 [Setaria italica]RCV06316.1 hypothetical protein SETIT_1G153400v2 [Setaria italica]
MAVRLAGPAPVFSLEAHSSWPPSCRSVPSRVIIRQSPHGSGAACTVRLGSEPERQRTHQLTSPSDTPATSAAPSRLPQPVPRRCSPATALQRPSGGPSALTTSTLPNRRHHMERPAGDGVRSRRQATERPRPVCAWVMPSSPIGCQAAPLQIG